jgi:gamma-F420-2:alpha-L-glutamate ligase
MAEKAASILGLDYCGVDVLIGPKGEPILCEVNSNAFIEGIEKVTGVNVASAYAHHIEKSIDRHFRPLFLVALIR